MIIGAGLSIVHVIRGIMHWTDLRLIATAGKTPGDRSYAIGTEGRGGCEETAPIGAAVLMRGPRLPSSLHGGDFWKAPGIWMRQPLPQPLLQSHAPAPDIDIGHMFKALVTSYREQIEWHLRAASLWVELAVGIMSLASVVRNRHQLSLSSAN